MSAILFGVFFIGLFVGLPVSISMGLSGMTAVLVDGRFMGMVVPQRFFNGINSFPLMAVPFFILAADLMSASGMTNSLIALHQRSRRVTSAAAWAMSTSSRACSSPGSAARPWPTRPAPARSHAHDAQGRLRRVLLRRLDRRHGHHRAHHSAQHHHGDLRHHGQPGDRGGAVPGGRGSGSPPGIGAGRINHSRLHHAAITSSAASGLP